MLRETDTIGRFGGDADSDSDNSDSDADGGGRACDLEAPFEAPVLVRGFEDQSLTSARFSADENTVYYFAGIDNAR